ncbi:MAG: hypothetical protein ABR928_09925 [Terracidiphilus sp.]|jgi:hypothetical protein
MMADPLWIEHCAEVSCGLLKLRSLLGDKKDVRWFDEYLDANELELALHVVCDFLLANISCQIGSEELNLIQVLHERMQITDDCCAQLERHDAKV